MGIKHTKVSAIADGSNPTQVRPSDWNDDHTIDGDVSFNGHDVTNVGNLGEFTDLEDVPATYAGSGNKLVAVNAGATGLTFIEPSAGGPVDEFTDLLDVPGSYSGQAGKVATVNAGETALEFTEGGNDIGWVTPQQFGAVADGNSHPLSAYYATLAEAQAAYSGAYYFVTSLTQQIDYAACKAASNEAFGGDLDEPDGDGILGGGNEGDYLQVGVGTGTEGSFTFRINDGEPDLIPNALVSQVAFVTYFSAPGFIATSQVVSNTTRVVTCVTNIALADDSMYAFGISGEHADSLRYLNKSVYLPGGKYIFGADTWLIRNLVSGVIRGAGRLTTALYADDIVMQFDGIWYSHLSDFSLHLTGVGTAALDIDGNVPGHPYTTRGVQGCTFDNLFMYAAGSPAACYMTRQGGSGGQGSECMFINCHWQGPCTFALYQQFGFNALAQIIMGGNFQDYTTHAAYFLGGGASFFNTGFQSTHPAEQVQNSGWDIRCGQSGAFDAYTVSGCRTESLQFINNGGGINIDCRACTITPAIGGWFQNIVVGAGHAINEGGRLYYTVAGGTTGSSYPDFYTVAKEIAATWPDIVDNTVTWTSLAVEGFKGVQQGALMLGGGSGTNNTIDYSLYPIAPGGAATYPYTAIVPRRYGNSEMVEYVTIDATYGDLIVWIMKSTGRITLIRTDDEPTNTVTIRSYGNFSDSGANAFPLHVGDSKTYYDQNTLVSGGNVYIRGGGGVYWQRRDLGSATVPLGDNHPMLTFDPGVITGDGRVTNSWELSCTKQGSTDCPELRVVGTVGYDTNADLGLVPMGTGVVKFGTRSAIAAETVTGYITIKDSGGTLRKLAVVS